MTIEAKKVRVTNPQSRYVAVSPNALIVGILKLLIQAPAVTVKKSFGMRRNKDRSPVEGFSSKVEMKVGLYVGNLKIPTR